MLIYLGFTENTREFTNFFKKTDAKSPTKSGVYWLAWLPLAPENHLIWNGYGHFEKK